MENILENKAKFFALYWDQYVVSWNGNPVKLQKVSMGHMDSEKYLELTPLSQITDEDVKYIWRIAGYSSETHCKELIDVNTEIGMPINSLTSDYLRSKGYALPYMDLSVEQQIEYGWIKLKITE